MDYVFNGLKIIAIMLFLLFLTLLTGRRKIAELPVFDFLVILIIGSFVGTYVAQPSGEFLYTLAILALLVLLHQIYILLVMKSRKAGRLLTFEPVVVIENGQFVKSNLKKLRYTIDNVLSMLREKDVFDLEEVEFAVVESSGRISVLKKSQYQPVTAKEIKLNTEYKGLSFPLIIEGEIYEDNLRKLQLDKNWLMQQLNSKGITSEKEVFFASVNTEGTLYISTGYQDNNFRAELRH